MHDENDVRRKVHVYKFRKEKLSKNCYGAIGTFTNGVLRIIDNDKEFTRSEPMQVEGKTLSDDVVQAIKSNGAIASTEASFKDEIVSGAWTIEDDY